MAEQTHTDGPVRGHTQHRGSFTIGIQQVWWRERENGEIIFGLNRDQPFYVFDRLIDELMLFDYPDESGDKKRDLLKLAVVNKILAYYRPFAMSDENNYYAASVGIAPRTRKPANKDTMYVEVNNSVAIEDEFVRGCAEKGMLSNCQKSKRTAGYSKEESAHINFREVYLMSGMMKENKRGKLEDVEPGHVACLCGECRKLMREHTKNARFIMVPTNDGSMELGINKDAKRIDDLNEGEAWEISHDIMYPLPEYRELDPIYAKTVMDGYNLITDPQRTAPSLKTFIDDAPIVDGRRQYTEEQQRKLEDHYQYLRMASPQLKDHPTMENINRSMMQLIKEAYDAHAEDDKRGDLEITAVIVKTTDGEFYHSVMVNGKAWLPSKPNAIAQALSNALNKKNVAEVYMASFDEAQIRSERDQEESGELVTPVLKMPDPSALGRIIKNTRKGDSPQLYVFPLNDGTMGEDELMAASPPIDVRESFGPDYTNPKKTKEALLGV